MNDNRAEALPTQRVPNKEFETITSGLRERLRDQVARQVAKELPFVTNAVAEKVGKAVAEEVEIYLAQIFGAQ